MTKRYGYKFNTIINFSSYIYQHSFKLRCVPIDNSAQRVMEKCVELDSSAAYSLAKDGFNNSLLIGEIVPEHKSFSIRSSGVVDVTDCVIHEECHVMYRCPSPLIDSVDSWPRPLLCFPDGLPLLDKAMSIAAHVYGWMEYMPGVTTTATTASAVSELRKGVCQDYAHLMIALCRHCGIAARYVSGFMQGEGVTHAWVEVYDGLCWIPVDPTHNRRVERGYIKLSHGRDAGDCPVNRGVFFGNALQHTHVEVLVEEL